MSDEWRSKPITEKQKKYIEEMHEFSEYPLPTFEGTTRGEASDYIDKWTKFAHEYLVDPYEIKQDYR